MENTNNIEPIINSNTLVDVPLDVVGPELSPEIENIPTDTCEPNIEQPTYTIQQYFGTLQDSVKIIWNYHLKTNKHFIHVELDYLYHFMLEKVDSLIETYMGTVGGNTIDTTFINTIFDIDKNEETYLRELVSYVMEGGKSLFTNTSEILSIIDEIAIAIDKTLYKLSTFKEDAIKTFESFCYENLEHIQENDDYSEEE